MGVWIGYRIYWPRLVITLNYNTIADLHILQITKAYDCNDFTSSCLVTAPTTVIPLLPCSGLFWMVAPFQLWIRVSVVLLIIARQGPLQKTPFPAAPPPLRAECCRGNLFVCDHCLEMGLPTIIWKTEHVFDKFPKNHMEILIGNFNAKSTFRYGSLHEINNSNGVRAVNFATSKIWLVKSW
jgi:hypothetical protein